MPVLVALVGLTLAAPFEGEQTVVLVARRTAVAPAVARALVADASSLLQAAGVPVAMTPDVALQQLARVSVKDTASCNGKRACLAELGRQLKVPWVVLLSVAAIDQELSLGFELLKVSDETVVETDSLLLARKGKLEAGQLAGFAGRVNARLVPVVAVVDTPLEPKLTPKEVEPPVTLPPPPPPERPHGHVTSFILGGAGVAALVAGGALIIVGAAARAPLTAGDRAPDGRVRSSLTFAEAEQLNASTTPLFIGGLGALAAGAGLGTAAVLTW